MLCSTPVCTIQLCSVLWPTSLLESILILSRRVYLFPGGTLTFSLADSNAALSLKQRTMKVHTLVSMSSGLVSVPTFTTHLASAADSASSPLSLLKVTARVTTLYRSRVRKNYAVEKLTLSSTPQHLEQS